MASLESVSLHCPEHLKLTENANGWTPIFWAARHGHIEVVEFLIDQGADLNQTDLTGGTVLRNARGDGIRKVLRDAGAVE